jgi:hypothetical protein
LDKSGAKNRTIEKDQKYVEYDSNLQSDAKKININVDEEKLELKIAKEIQMNNLERE